MNPAPTTPETPAPTSWPPPSADPRPRRPSGTSSSVSACQPRSNCTGATRTPTRRSAITHTVAACDIDHVVIVRVGADQERPERRRRKCLERLLHELEARSILDVVLESRGRADDRRDIQMLNALRGQHYLSTSIRLTHVVGRYEPMLWIPDAVCGAVTSARIGDPSHQSILNQRLTLIEIAGPQ